MTLLEMARRARRHPEIIAGVAEHDQNAAEAREAVRDLGAEEFVALWNRSRQQSDDVLTVALYRLAAVKLVELFLELCDEIEE